MPRGFTIQITHSITQAESPFMDVLSNYTCTGIINDKTMPHIIYIKYKIWIQCIGARVYTNMFITSRNKQSLRFTISINQTYQCSLMLFCHLCISLNPQVWLLTQSSALFSHFLSPFRHIDVFLICRTPHSIILSSLSPSQPLFSSKQQSPPPIETNQN